MVKRYLKNENGFTLVQTLSTFILVTLLGMGLIMLAFKVSEQITATQTINQVKNQKVYVSQEAKLTLDRELEEVFSEENLQDNPLGETESTLRSLMKQFVSDHQLINEGQIGKSKKVTYENRLLGADIEPIDIVSPGDGEEQGWVDQPGVGEGIQYKAFRVTMPIESFIRDEKGERTVNSNYVYEIQWESKQDGELLTETDIWGNIYYQINRPGGLIPLSADSVTRKMAKIYHFQDETPTYLEDFPASELSKKTLDGTHGVKQPYVSDVTDGNRTFNNDVGQLGFEGSLLLTNGFDLKGAGRQSQLVTKNLLALSNLGEKSNTIQKSRIEDLSIDARAGMYLGIEPSNDSKQEIRIDNSSQASIDTTNLVINNTISRDNDKVATYIDNGEIAIKNTSNEVTDFRQYKGNSNTLNLQKNNWDQYQRGNMVISHSKVNISSNQKRSGSTHIKVDNNFMLTNAGMSGDLQEDSFSYFEDENQEIIRQPSELTLSGANTLLEVSNYSFIDSPKRYQRQLKGDYKPETQIYVNNQGFNKIKLEDKSQMRLGYTGVEAFRFESEKDTVFSMKVLPEVALFNPYFLEKGFNNDEIEGKVILETFEEKDSVALSGMLASRGIPFEIKNHVDGNFSNCDNGIVTIYNYKTKENKETYEFVTRYFSYITDLEYK